MKKIKSYKCDFCKKLLQTQSGMKKHEEKCFYNPKTNSCITCNSLVIASFIGDKKLTEKEESILRYEIEGTFKAEYTLDEGMINQLNEEYIYLYDAEICSYCTRKDMKLNKLKTKCEVWTKK